MSILLMMQDSRLSGRIFLTLVYWAAICAGSDAYFPPSDVDGGWRTLKSRDELRSVAGMSARRLDAAFEYAQRTSQHGGLLVVRHGWLVYERYYGRGNREAVPAMASVGKAYTSIACGIMLAEKKADIPMGLDQRVFTAKYLPQAFPPDDPRKSEITLGQLLSMAAGIHGEGSNPGFVNGEPKVKLQPVPRSADPADQDRNALSAPLWTAPGAGYSYASDSPHIASIVLRNVTGKEMQQYIEERLAKPMKWGPWGYALNRRNGRLPHAPGGGDIAVRSTDVLRFGYLLLHGGEWQGKQLVPPEYVEQCSKPTRFQRHAPFSLMFEVNADQHVAAAPADAYFKSGGGGFGLYIIPSLDMVIYKMAGSDGQYDPELTGIPQKYNYDGSRDNWKPGPHTQFSDGPIGTDDGVRRVLEMVAAAVIDE